MIIAQIVDATRYPDGTIVSTTYGLTSDVGYSPDVAADLAIRVVAMRCIDELVDEETDTEETDS